MKGVERRWAIRRQLRGEGIEYLRIEHDDDTGGWEIHWVSDINRAVPFSRWATTYKWLTHPEYPTHVERWRPVFVGRDPQGVQRNLDRCLLAPPAREYVESTLMPETLQSRYLPHAVGTVDVLGGKRISQADLYTIIHEVYKQELAHKRAQAKDIPAIILLDAIKRIQDHSPQWATLADVMMQSMSGFPFKVVWAKTRKLQRQGLITGVSRWDSRNEYELTDEGKEYWQRCRDSIEKAVRASGIWTPENRDRLLFNHFREAEHG